jgi:hypothetical protein
MGAVIEGELIGPDAIPVPFDRRLIVPYALRNSTAGATLMPACPSTCCVS